MKNKKNLIIWSAWIILVILILLVIIYESKKGKSPPIEAIQACSDKSIGDTCSFQDKEYVSSGICNDKPGILACAPDKNTNQKIWNNKQIRNTDEEQRVKILSIATQEKQKTKSLYDTIILLNEEWRKINVINTKLEEYQQDLSGLFIEYGNIINDIQNNWFSQSLKQRFITLTEKAKALVENIKSEIQKIKDNNK